VDRDFRHPESVTSVALIVHPNRAVGYHFASSTIWVDNLLANFFIVGEMVCGGVMSRFEGQVAIVTGGALGIGGATARKLASEGASVFIADIDDAAAADNRDRIERAGGMAATSHVDVSQSDDISRMVNEVVDQYGHLDILVQNAFGVIAGESRIHGGATAVNESDWDYGFDVLLKALYLGAKYAIPHMKASGGNIINLASVHSFLQEPGMLVYEAAKAGVVGFYADQYPVRRTGTPDDIANGIAFLCSDEASFITGHTLAIDGGLTVQLQETFGLRQAVYAREHPDRRLPD
jgi:NAD(P)-dependent dehydrogenase (short-subunit alcohol dehydrogenase family)